MLLCNVGGTRTCSLQLPSVIYKRTDPLEDGPDFHHTLTDARYREMHLPQNVDADSDKNYEDAGDGDHCKHPVVQNTNFCNTNVVIWR